MLLLLAGCATREPAPVEDRVAWSQSGSATQASAPPPAPTAAETEARPQTYTVKRGDTLHQIALDNGLDYRELAAWNNLENPNVIRVGQVLRLSSPNESGAAVAATGVTTAPLRVPPPVVAEGKPAPSPSPPAVARSSDTVKSAPKMLKEPYSERAVRELTAAGATVAAAPSPAAPADGIAAAPSRADAKSETVRPPVSDNGDDDRLDWAWPAKGKLIGAFSETANLKGIDIAGTAGEPVLASAPGRVVYAGTGLRGYGKLIIIKHNNIYLSAYAHNREILVKEGQQVFRGQKIAEMGNTDAEQVKLHFEIRRLGKPMDPVRYLPPA
ncbi:MAG TPA: peptidoglycan DD-metalloendopeptidase family protein [Casimicrobiaceae bacterium]